MSGFPYAVWLTRQILATDRRGNFTVPLCDPADLAAWLRKREPVASLPAKKPVQRQRKAVPKADADGKWRL